MPNEKLEKLRHKQYVAERKLTADIEEAFAETEAQAKNTSPDLVILLRDYLNLRKAERSDWSRYGQQKGTTDDLKAVSKAMIYLKEHEQSNNQPEQNPQQQKKQDMEL